MNSQDWLSIAKPLKWKSIFEVFQERADSVELLVESIHSDAEFKGKFVKNKHSWRFLCQIINKGTAIKAKLLLSPQIKFSLDNHRSAVVKMIRKRFTGVFLSYLSPAFCPLSSESALNL